MKIGFEGSMTIRRRNALAGAAFAAPAVFGFALFFALPFLMGFFYSFSGSNGVFRWAGFDNYERLFRSGAFRLGCFNTLRFIGAGVPLVIAFSMMMALLLDGMAKRRSRLYPAAFAVNMYPMVMPSGAVILFVQVLFERYGMLNSILKTCGRPPVEWLYSGSAFWVMTALYIWKNYSYCMIVFLAGFRGIDREIYEAAAMDGAGAVRKFFSLTVPELAPILTFNIVISMVNVFRIYRESYLLFGNYPNDSVYMLQNYMNNVFYSFNYLQMYAAATVFLLIMSAVVIFMLRYNGKERERQS